MLPGRAWTTRLASSPTRGVTRLSSTAGMEFVRLQVPEGNVRVPLPEFEAVWTEAERLFREDPRSRYVGGVCAACRWVAGHPQGLSPLYREKVPATAELILRENMLATMTYLGSPDGDPAIDVDWAAGVALALGWARGALEDSPLGRR
jgi:hypothetical protein